MSALRRRLALDRPELIAWALYDWANSAMLTVVVTAVFPIFFVRVSAAGLAPEVATSRFTLTTTACMLVAACLAPFLGAVADVSAKKKLFLGCFLSLGAGSCGAMFFLSHGEWVQALVLFALANVGATASFVFYDSLLPHVAREGEVDRLSTSGYALGYVGGGIALAVVMLLVSSPERFGLPTAAGSTGDAATLPRI